MLQFTWENMCHEPRENSYVRGVHKIHYNYGASTIILITQQHIFFYRANKALHIFFWRPMSKTQFALIFLFKQNA